MEHRFDVLAKQLSRSVSRRDTLRAFGAGIAGILIASFGVRLRASSKDCGEFCAECCKNLNPPPRGEEMAQCIQDCHNGAGICGPIVCPDGINS